MNRLQVVCHWVFLCLIAAWSSISFAGETVESVRLWRAPDSTRVVFDLSGPVEHSVFSLDNPRRLVVDIRSTALGTSLEDVSLAGTPIRKIRSGVRNGGDLRVVFDLGDKVKTNSFMLARHADKSDRLVIDFDDLNAGAIPAMEVVDANSGERRDIVIAIDAGHGGEDPGAIGSNRVYEKDVVLDISRQLAKIVDATPGYRAELIRDGDYAIALKERRNIARKKRADLFVSIHADAFKHKSARGASVFALNPHGRRATSETARYLAQRENEADLIGGVGTVSLSDKDEVLAGMLLDLSMTATLSSSLQVGDQILRAMGGIAKLHKRNVEQADFAVLRSPDMPSLLVETGFISNPGEAKRLSTPTYRRELARTIFSGIQNYFNQTPPPGTYLAWRQSNGFGEHVISRGETLSGIAEQYNVPLSELLSANELNDTVIRVGQRLKIPTS
ncbi:N-acetylmuramoyl-L-alanine amidase [Gilvimarinus sp. F26214L]|uniref:N-acetylmuramoyl-L-alanine amidase n=1 Tax=Gilvimarinus sp. DZF01 TaxID=3461371 RepID=UPI004046136E